MFVWRLGKHSEMIILPKQYTEANIRILFVCGNNRDIQSIELMSRISLISTLFYIITGPEEFAQSASEFNHSNLPNVICIDLDENMVENLAFVKKLKRNEAFRYAPVLGFTSGADENIMNSASYRGIDEMLIKDDSREVLKRNCEVIFACWFETSDTYFVE